MSEQDAWWPFVALELANGSYQLGYDTGGRMKAFVRLPRAVVEEVVVQALFVELEIGTDGTLLAITPAAVEPLGTASLSALVTAALDGNLAGQARAPVELRGLEEELERALRAVRAARQGRGG
jgi:hypothetical protein